MSHDPHYQSEHAVSQNSIANGPLNRAPATVQELTTLVQFHDCVQTHSIATVRLSTASAQCRTCQDNTFARDTHASVMRNGAATQLSLSTCCKAFPIADRVLEHLASSPSSPVAMKAAFERKRAGRPRDEETQ